MPTADELSTGLHSSVGATAGPPAAAVRVRAHRLRRRRTAGRWATAACALVLVAGAASATTAWLTRSESTEIGAPGSEPPARVLLDATRSDDHDAMRAALAAGADPNRAERFGITPLMVAAIRGDATSAALLLAAGAYPGRTDEYGRTALVLAVQYGSADVLVRLVEAGAQVDVRMYDFRRTPAMDAASRGDLEALAILAAAGADLDARDSSGRTVLQYAHDSPDPARVVARLLELGATAAPGD